MYPPVSGSVKRRCEENLTDSRIEAESMPDKDVIELPSSAKTSGYFEMCGSYRPR